ncbi:hypothetical protein [Sulfobacillus thermosulfidooxidans]|uniref:hypothetical protein n=1 Tax=Sulfobacillus thermosulfidooxidans TaxID=28034 RepID=UPI0006B4DC25|nr:hypothetical protein [Sulfobacillus thermosulfidooxidans]
MTLRAAWDDAQHDAAIVQGRQWQGVTPRVTIDRINRYFRRVLAPWQDREAPITWRAGHPRHGPTQWRGRIVSVGPTGMVVGAVNSANEVIWRTFISWVDLWAGHVSVVTPATCDHDIQTARSRLSTITVARSREQEGLW